MLSSDYIATRQRTERLCKPLSIEDYVPQIVEFASPPKWHLAHTSWFFETMVLEEFLPGYQKFNPNYNALFNSYYQSIGLPFARHQRGVITRPSVSEVYAYRAHVDQHMAVLFERELSKPVKDLVTLGCQHEQQHQELLITDLKLVLAYNPTDPVYDSSFDEGLDSLVRKARWLELAASDVQIGHSGEGFYFDNEAPRHRVHIPDFAIQNEQVSNEEYAEFIAAGGYEKFEYWYDEGWDWVNNNAIQHPLYWRREEDGWSHFTLSGRQKLNPKSAVAHISYYEASAYANWKGYRLPSEFEWEVASNQFSWGNRWEWTCTAYQAYPGFEVSAGAVGEYNGKFMVNQMVLKGASVVTAPGHSRPTYRNFFHPHHQWQYSGLRLAK